jgi:leader peptidase (prepilin peptidase) / N-methyltransferase
MTSNRAIWLRPRPNRASPRLTAVTTSDLAAAAVGAAGCLAVSPYLARLARTVPDGENRVWYRGAAAGRSRLVKTAIAAAVLGALGGAAAGWSALLPAFLALALAGAPLILIDYEHHRLPNRLVYPAALAALVLLAVAAAVRGEWNDYLRAVIAGAVAYAVLFTMMLISPRSFGWGDVRLGGVLGLYLGYDSWVAVYYGIFGGFVLGAVLALVLLAARRATMKTALAFGPMLLLGALLVLAFNLTP